MFEIWGRRNSINVQKVMWTVAELALGPVAYRWYALPIEWPTVPNVAAWCRLLARRPAFAEHVMLPLT
jgi:glutathione S-transferase